MTAFGRSETVATSYLPQPDGPLSHKRTVFRSNRHWCRIDFSMHSVSGYRWPIYGRKKAPSPRPIPDYY
jgi:hypothetical protein